MKPNECLVLSLFPGADLFGKVFQELEFVVVLGPEKMMGGNIKEFKDIKDKFQLINRI